MFPIIYNGDLTGRVISINADLWSDLEMRQVIEKGANLLNIKFEEEFIEELIKKSSENIYLIQEACHRVCMENDISETQKTCKTIFLSKSISSKAAITSLTSSTSSSSCLYVVS